MFLSFSMSHVSKKGFHTFALRNAIFSSLDYCKTDMQVLKFNGLFKNKKINRR